MSRSKEISKPLSPKYVDTSVKAAALKYDGQNSPRVIAKGQGETAKQIIQVAEENEILLHYDPLLIEVLSKLELGEEIPDTLYLAVAKVIAFAYYLQGKAPEQTNEDLQ